MRPRVGVIAAVVVLAVVMWGIGWAVNYTNIPSFCASCHIIEPFYQSWKTASHAARGVTCIDCHFHPGPIGYLQGKAYSVLKLAEFTIGAYEAPTGARLVANENCLECHAAILTKGLALTGGLTFYHEKHVDKAQAECRGCHTAIGHPGAVVAAIVTQPAPIARDTCLRCHDGTRAPQIIGEAVRSGKSHPGDPKIDTGVLKQNHWKAVTGSTTLQGVTLTRLDLQTCATCHGAKSAAACQSCHGRERFSYSEASRECLRCHQATMTQTLVAVSNLPFVHEEHLTKNKIECQTCHVRLVHQEICANCHDGTRAPAIFGRR